MSNTSNVYVIDSLDSAELVLAFGQLVVDLQSAIVCGTGVDWLTRQMGKDGYEETDMTSIVALQAHISDGAPRLTVTFKYPDPEDDEGGELQGNYYLRIDPIQNTVIGDF